jgi:hypothetical protein
LVVFLPPVVHRRWRVPERFTSFSCLLHALVPGLRRVWRTRELLLSGVYSVGFERGFKTRDDEMEIGDGRLLESEDVFESKRLLYKTAAMEHLVFFKCLLGRRNPTFSRCHAMPIPSKGSRRLRILVQSVRLIDDDKSDTHSHILNASTMTYDD